MASAYADNLQLADANEKITESVCDMALTIYNRLVLKAPTVFRLLMDLDETEGVNNPLDRVTKLQTLVIKANTKDKLEWVVPLLIDLYKTGRLSIESCSHRAWSGAPKVNKGLCDV